MGEEHEEISAILVKQFISGEWIQLGLYILPDSKNEDEYCRIDADKLWQNGIVTGLIDPTEDTTYVSTCLSSGPMKFSPFTDGKRSMEWIIKMYQRTIIDESSKYSGSS